MDAEGRSPLRSSHADSAECDAPSAGSAEIELEGQALGHLQSIGYARDEK